VEEIVLFLKGNIDLGYYIKKRIFFKLRMKERLAIGAFQVTFNKECEFVYKSAGLCEGFSIRRPKWHQILKKGDKRLVNSLK
jgi:hypothetical protein